MKLAGDKGVVSYFLRDCQNKNLSNHTMLYYRRSLSLLVEFLDRLCEVSEVEDVTVFHLRDCLSALANMPIGDRSRASQG